MQPKRTKTLTGVTSLRLTPDEEKQIARAADERGLTKSQWLRQTILQALKGSPESLVMLAELMALRAVILPLHAEILKGNRLTDAFIAETLKQADARKYTMAENRLLALREKEK
jgi:hypothetical protein